jgi:hypothetical protein
MTPDQFKKMLELAKDRNSQPMVLSMISSKMDYGNVLAFMLISHEIYLRDVDGTINNITAHNLTTQCKKVLREGLTISFESFDFYLGQKLNITDVMELLTKSSDFQDEINIEYVFDAYGKVLQEGKKLLLSKVAESKKDVSISDQVFNNDNDLLF